MAENLDLFGNVIVTDPILREQFKEPPFSVLDTKTGSWQNRKKTWQGLGIKSEVGRDASVINMDTLKKDKNTTNYTSIFDPALCEVLYHWFCPEKGEILDPFAGGSVRGIVANKLGYSYTGVDIRQEQIDSNYEQGKAILGDNCPNWICGDSNVVLTIHDNEYPFFNCAEKFDFVFSCPPYADLEVYSELPGDISNMDYNSFLKAYEQIIEKCFVLLKKDSYACFVVGEVRDRKGHYIGFVPDTIRAFQKAGFAYYNEAILLNPVASASMRANGNMKTQKLVKIHQNVLVFKKM